MADRLATLEIALIGRISDFMSKMDTADKRIDTFSTKTATLGRNMSQMGVGMAAIGAAVAIPLGLATRSVIKTGATFEQTMRNVQSVSNATSQEFLQMSEFAEKMGKTTVFRATEAAQAMYFLGSAGYSAQRQMEALEPILALAAATQSDLAYSSEIVVSSLNAFRLPATQAARVANVFAAGISNSQLTMSRLGTALPYVAAVAKNFGITVEETVGTLGTLVSAGIRAESAGAKLRTSLLMLTDVSKKGREALAEMGLTTEDVNPQLNTLTEIIRKFEDAGLDAEKASKIFGKRGAEIWVTLAQTGAEAVADLTDKVTGTNRAFEMMDLQMDTVEGAMKLLKSAIEGIKIEVFKVLRDDLKRLIEVLRTVASAISNFAEKHPVLIKWMARLAIIVGGLVASIGLLGGGFLILGGQVLNTVSHIGDFVKIGRVMSGVLTAIATKLLMIVAILAAFAIGLEIGNYLNQWERLRQIVQEIQLLGQIPFKLGDAIRGLTGDQAARQRLIEFFQLFNREVSDIGEEPVQRLSLVDKVMQEIENAFYRAEEAANAARQRFDQLGDSSSDLAENADAVASAFGELTMPTGFDMARFAPPPAPTVPSIAPSADELQRAADARRIIYERAGLIREMYQMTLDQRRQLLESYGTEEDFLNQATAADTERWNVLTDRLIGYQEQLADDNPWATWIANAQRAADLSTMGFTVLNRVIDGLANAIGSSIVRAFGKANSAVVKFFSQLLADIASAIAKALMLKLILSAIGGGGAPSFASLLTEHFQAARPDFWARYEGGRILDLFAQGLQRNVSTAPVMTEELASETLATRPYIIKPVIHVEEATPMTKVRVFEDWTRERLDEYLAGQTEDIED